MNRLAVRFAQLAIAIAPALCLAWLKWTGSTTSGLALFGVQAATLATPLGILGWYYHAFPDSTFVRAGAVVAVLSLGLLANSWFANLVWAADVAVAIVALADLLTLPRGKSFTTERQAQRVASLRKLHPINLEIRNLANRAFDVLLRDGVPEGLVAEPATLRHRIPPRSRLVVEYSITPRRRGAFTVGPLFLRVRSRLGFWQRLLRYPIESTLHVYPDLRQLSQYAVLARLDRLNLLGIRRARRFGQDNEFERLRDYNTGDNYKHIDWRATARRRRLTVKDFQQNQSQRLMFLIDCGRMMTNEVAGLSLLDHAFNAALMLSYVALTRGDSVGLITFSEDIHGYVPPRGGVNHMNRLLHGCFDRFPRLVESRYDRAFVYLESHSRKRSLVILITNLIDDVNRNQIESYLRNLAGRHLPLGVLLRDRRIYDYMFDGPATGSRLYQKAAAADILAWRHQALADLRAGGVLSLDVFPDDLTAPLINRYLEIKARHLL